MFDGKGGTVPYDPSKHYLEETITALRLWVVRNCCNEDRSRYRAAGAAMDLRMALQQIDTMTTWLRFHSKDGLASEIQEQARELLEAAPFKRHTKKDDARRTALDDRRFDKLKMQLWRMVQDFRVMLERVLVLVRETATPTSSSTSNVSVAAPPNGTSLPSPESRCAPMKKTAIAARILNKANTKDVRPRSVGKMLAKCDLRDEGNGNWTIRLDAAILSAEVIDRLNTRDWPPPPRVK
ncbi:MAG: hypothetical protein WCK05_15735 [Planctomycetota bacterium]